VAERGLLSRLEAQLAGWGVVEGDCLVVGVSGGRDSMVLADLVNRSRWRQGAVFAHAHFGLRGEDSEADAALVRGFAAQCGVAYVEQRLDARGKAAQQGAGLQAAARTLRYGWWAELAATATVDAEGTGPRRSWILTAHHAGDQLETLWLQWIRSGETGAMKGMPARRGNILRPLLLCSPSELEVHAQQFDVPFRHDASNDSPRYLRNRIRHELIPLLESLRPGTGERMLRGRSDASKGSREIVPSQPATPDAPPAVMALPEPGATPEAWAQIERWGRAWGARKKAVAEVMRWASGPAGRALRTPQATLWRERTHLVAVPHMPIARTDRAVPPTPVLRWHFLPSGPIPAPDVLRNTPPEVCLLDLDTVAQPLQVRPWQPGDRMQPFGMSGHQRISDLLNQHHWPRHSRADAHVLVDALGNLLWLIGIRTAQRGALTPETQNILRLTWVPTT